MKKSGEEEVMGFLVFFWCVIGLGVMIPGVLAYASEGQYGIAAIFFVVGNFCGWILGRRF